MKAAAHVFISYVEGNSSVALAIAQELRQLGHETWTYEENGVPGHSYLEQVHSAIHRCDAFVLLASTESLKSHQVSREAETAYEQQKLVIPVRLSIKHDELQAVPIFRMVSGTAVSVATDGTNPRKVAERIAASLQKAGFREEDSSSLPRKADVVQSPEPAAPSTARGERSGQTRKPRRPLLAMSLAISLLGSSLLLFALSPDGRPLAIIGAILGALLYLITLLRR